MIRMAIVIIMVTVLPMTSMIIMVVVNMNLAIKVLGFSPDKGWTDSGLNGERTSIA